MDFNKDSALGPNHSNRFHERERTIETLLSHYPSIDKIGKFLGFGPRFSEHPRYKDLLGRVQKLSKGLPKDLKGLVDFTTNAHSLNEGLDELLHSCGSPIWGKHADRTLLLQPMPHEGLYPKHLIYEEPKDRDHIKTYVRMWIIVKAAYTIRRRKRKNALCEKQTKEISDIDGESLSPPSITQSSTPPDGHFNTGIDLSVPSKNPNKRKIDIYLADSDDNKTDSTPINCLYDATRIKRKGNMSGVPAYNHRFSPAPESGPETAGTPLAPLVSNELNAVQKPFAVLQDPKSVIPTAVNTYDFTPFITTRSAQETYGDLVREATQENLDEIRGRSSGSDHNNSNSHSRVREPSSPRLAPPRDAEPLRSVMSALSTTARENYVLPPLAAIVSSNLDDRHMKKESPVDQHPQNALITQLPSQQSQSSQQQKRQHSQPQYKQHTTHSYHGQTQHHLSLPRPCYANNASTHNFGQSVPFDPRYGPNTPVAQATTGPITEPTSAHSSQGTTAYDIKLVPTRDVAPVAPAGRPAPSSVITPTPQHACNQVMPKIQRAEAAPFIFPMHQSCEELQKLQWLQKLQCQFTRSLWTVFSPANDRPVNEKALLHQLHSLWYYGASRFRIELSNEYDQLQNTLAVWVRKRQIIAKLRVLMAARSASRDVLVERAREMNELRMAIIHWKTLSADDSTSPEERLCKVFEVMTNTEGSRDLMMDGLQRLNLEESQFFSSEDLKIVLQAASF